MTPEIDAKLAELRATYGPASMDRVTGMLEARAERAPEQKSKFVLPGLPKVPWLDPYQYPEIAHIARGLEELFPQIRREIVTIADETPERLPRYDHYAVNDEKWRALYIHQRGAYVEESRALVPATYDFAREVIDPQLCHLLEIHFSILNDRVEIPPHCDLWNFSVNLHLAIEIPADCGITVAGETREWTEGKTLLFDYSFMHNAWSRSGKRRTVLMMDLWHPEVTPAERVALTFVIAEIRKLIGETS